ncbi:hypothetical protein HanRHA438_Chr16g0746731 [Helianthus annuus]|nr:hypothetical protein HanRHA438_Chr16g0746731 [Helianthus annuus]
MDGWFKHIFRGCARVFFSLKNTLIFFFQGLCLPSLTWLHLGPPLRMRNYCIINCCNTCVVRMYVVM